MSEEIAAEDCLKEIRRHFNIDKFDRVSIPLNDFSSLIASVEFIVAMHSESVSSPHEVRPYCVTDNEYWPCRTISTITHILNSHE